MSLRRVVCLPFSWSVCLLRRPVACAAVSAPARAVPIRRVGAFLILCLSGLVRAIAALEDHWLGDLIGAASLFGMLWLALLIGHGLGVSP